MTNMITSNTAEKVTKFGLEALKLANILLCIAKNDSGSIIN